MTDIRQWLDSLSLSQYAAAFEESAIEWEHLPDLDHEVLQALGVAALESHTGPRLRVRVGIATGLVVAGELIGKGASQERAVVDAKHVSVSAE